MAGGPVSVVIVDLDNTLWDWVDIWYRSFRAMLDEVVKISGISEEDLYEPISAVHKKHGTSEYSFLLEEVEPLRAKHPDGNILEIYKPAIRAYRDARRQALVLYPSVFETLWKFRDFGCLVVAYTESQEYYTNYRIRRLGLDGLIDIVYSPRDHELPAGLTPDQIRRYRADTYRLKRTQHRFTPKGEFKPNPDILRTILEDVGAQPSNAIYIGDSEMRDLAMAQDCGIRDVHAKYGVAQGRAQYELLRKVTHWKKEDVEREKQIQARGEVRPTYVLDHSFSQVLALFDFTPFARKAATVQDTLSVWSKTVDVQQHFNDIQLKIRNYAITLMVAVIGGAAVLAKEPRLVVLGLWRVASLGIAVLAILLTIIRTGDRSRRERAKWLVLNGIWGVGLVLLAFFVIPDDPHISIPVSAVVVTAGAVGWAAFYFMDRWWYHRFLKGAVVEGIELEDALHGSVPGQGLTKAIGAASPFTFWGTKVDSNRRVNWFYGMILFMLVGLFLASFAVGPAPKPANTPAVPADTTRAQPDTSNTAPPLPRDTSPRDTTPGDTARTTTTG